MTKRVGYHVTPMGALHWRPHGWALGPPAVIAPEGTSGPELVLRQREHRRRIADGTAQAQDWPPYLLHRFRDGRAEPYYVVLIDPLTGKRGKRSWWPTLAEALAHGEKNIVRCADPAQKDAP